MVSSPARQVHEERSRRRESPTGEDAQDSGNRVAGTEAGWRCQRKYKSRRRLGLAQCARPNERWLALREMRQLEERGVSLAKSAWVSGKDAEPCCPHSRTRSRCRSATRRMSL